MAKLGQVLTKLSRYRRAFDSAFGAAQAPPISIPSRLHEVANFGPNPGDLRMLTYVPNGLSDKPSLVVVLHGCTQTAAGYDHGTGWSRLADQLGFAVLFPEQKSSNNPRGCFTWFQHEDTQRDRGEAHSIRSMIAHMATNHGVDPERIFITGLSAGAAMANVMLATYPEVFAAGAIIAGLPYGAAASVPEAFEAMFKGANRPARAWGDLVRAASAHRGPWPKVSVWHGSADRTVVLSNAAEIVKQWRDLHHLPARPTAHETGPVFSRAVWRDGSGRDMIESVTIPGMAHGTPLATGEGDQRCGNAGPFLLDVGISSTHHIAQFFGLLATEVREQPAFHVGASAERPVPITPRPEDILLPSDQRFAKTVEDEAPTKPARPFPIDVDGVIKSALRAAGLMR